MITDLDMDIIRMAETNTNWHQTPEQHLLKERVSTLWEGKHMITAHNSNYKTAQHDQWG